MQSRDDLKYLGECACEYVKYKYYAILQKELECLWILYGAGRYWNQIPMDTKGQLYIKHQLAILKAHFLFFTATLSIIIPSSVRETKSQSNIIICSRLSSNWEVEAGFKPWSI